MTMQLGLVNYEFEEESQRAKTKSASMPKNCEIGEEQTPMDVINRQRAVRRSLHVIGAVLIALCLLCVAHADVQEAQPIGVANLVKQETDISQLPNLRDWTSNLQSSYDRTGGNADFNHYLSVTGTEGVMADMEGPGAIVRMWSANPTGTIKIYIDGSQTPIIEQPFKSLFDGSYPPFIAPLSSPSSSGFYTYFPIPYAHHCRVVLDGGKNVYYHVNYLTFPAGTKVTSFRLPLSVADQSAVDAANATWSAISEPEMANATLDAAKEVQPGKTTTLGSYRGPAMVQQITLAVPQATDAELRLMVLRAYFDGHETPDIQAPVADFFGNAFDRKPFHTTLLGRTAEGVAVADFPMPFGHSARFTLENGSRRPLAATWGATVAKQRFNSKNDGYFHALWTQETTRTGFPHVWARVKNQRGRFIGVVQTMQADTGISFLEGDDQFRVDKQTWLPSQVKTTVVGPWNGTGTEDCFNSAWYFSGGPNSLPVNALLVKNEHAGQIDCMRWFFNDAPTFQSSLDGQIEHGGVNDPPNCYYSSVAYWYSNGPVQSWYHMPAASALALPAPRAVFKLPGAIEGESLIPTTKVSAGEVSDQTMSPFPGHVWSGDGQLFWTGAKVNDTLTLTLTPPAAGTYDLVGYFTKAPDYGTVSIQLNGSIIGGPLDGYDKSVISSGPVDLGKVTLPAGPSAMVVTITGKNDSATNTFFGLDALSLNALGSKPAAIPGN